MNTVIMCLDFVLCLKYEKQNPGIIFYRYDHVGTYNRIFVRGKGGPQTASLSSGLKPAYKCMLPISKEKKDDLIRLCR